MAEEFQSLGHFTRNTNPGFKTPVVQSPSMGRKIFPGLSEAIGAAQKAIPPESYAFFDGEFGHQSLDALLADFQHGVRVLLVSFGSRFLQDKNSNRSWLLQQECAV